MREAISNLFNFGEDVGFSEQVILLLILELHFGAAELRQENLISDFHAHRDVLTGLKLIQLNENTRELVDSILPGFSLQVRQQRRFLSGPCLVPSLG